MIPLRSRASVLGFLVFFVLIVVLGVSVYQVRKGMSAVLPKTQSSAEGSNLAETAILESARAAAENELKEIQSVKDKQVAIENDQKAIKIMLLEALDPRHSMTVDATSDHEYRRLKTAAVDLLVKAEGVVKIDGGYRLRFLVANPSAIKLGGIVVHLEWGKPYPKEESPKEVMDWLKNLRKRDVTLTDLFPPGKWTTIDLDLTPAEESELHAVTLQFKPLTLGLD